MISPLLLLFEAVPGKNAFKYWIMNLVGNLIIFPIMIFVFILAYLIIFDTASSDMTARLPYLYGIDSNSFRLMIGLGIIFLIPDFVKAIKEALGIKELPFQIGVGTYFGGLAAGGGAAMGAIGQFGSISLALGAFNSGGILANTGLGKTVQGFLGFNRNKTGGADTGDVDKKGQ